MNVSSFFHLTRAVAILFWIGGAAGAYAAGQVVAWGDNIAGQATVPSGLSSAVLVAGGFSHSLALKSDGTVSAWGYNFSGQAVPPAGLANVVAIAAGLSH